MKLNDLKNSTASELIEAFGTGTSACQNADACVALGLPSKKQEEYRYADIETILNLELAKSRQERPAEILPAVQLVITDGVVTHAPADIKLGYSQSIPCDKDHFDALYHLGHVASQGVWEIELSGEVNLHIIHRFTQPASLIPYRIAVHVTSNSQALCMSSLWMPVLLRAWYSMVMTCLSAGMLHSK